MIQLNSDKHTYALNVPTSFSEISQDYLAKVSNHIVLSDHQVLIALVAGIKLSELIWTMNDTKHEAKMGITPIIVKSATKGFTPGHVAIITDTDLSRGVHVNIPSAITSGSVTNYLAKDDELRKAIQVGDATLEDGTRMSDIMIKVLQFKIVPTVDIKAHYELMTSIKDEFVIAKD